jgi:hypothetical protein
VPARRRGDLEERIGLRRHLLADQRAVDALERRRPGGVDPRDRGVRVRRADEVDVAHVVRLHVVDEQALALDEPLVLLARDADADEAALLLALLDDDGRAGADGVELGLGHVTSPRAAASTASTMFA